MALPGVFSRPIRGTDGVILDSELARCFHVVDADDIRTEREGRTWNTPSYQAHEFKMIAVSSKGAGGTGKTTTAWSTAYALARGGDRVVLLNADGQPSVEERALGKLVNMHFRNESGDGDLDAFYAANGLEGETLLTGMRGLIRCPDLRMNNPAEHHFLPRLVGIDVQKLESIKHAGPGEPDPTR